MAADALSPLSNAWARCWACVRGLEALAERCLVRVGDRLDQARAVVGHGLGEDLRGLGRVVDTEGAQAAGARHGLEVDGVQFAALLRVAQQSGLLSHLQGQGVVVEYDDLDGQVVLGEGG